MRKKCKKLSYISHNSVKPFTIDPVCLVQLKSFLVPDWLFSRKRLFKKSLLLKNVMKVNYNHYTFSSSITTCDVIFVNLTITFIGLIESNMSMLYCLGVFSGHNEFAGFQGDFHCSFILKSFLLSVSICNKFQ